MNKLLPATILIKRNYSTQVGYPIAVVVTSAIKIMSCYRSRFIVYVNAVVHVSPVIKWCNERLSVYKDIR